MSAFSAVRITLKDRAARARSLAVAVSGGADSLALMILLAKQELKPVVLTVNHGMRLEAEAEADYVGKIAKQFNLPHVVLSSSQAAPTTQAEARTLRYDLLSQWCNDKGIAFCALAHHAKDQAETFLFRLYRGSGVEGLAAMQDEMVYQGCHFIRPLLDADPEALKEFLRQENIKWCEDPSNHSAKYMRTHLGALLQNLPLSFDELSKSAAGANAIKQELNKRIRTFLSKKGQASSAGYCVIDKAALVAQKEMMTHAILAYAIQWVTGAAFRPRALALQTLRQEIATNTKAKTLAHCHIVEKAGQLYFFKEQAHIAPPQHDAKVWDNRFYFDGDLPKGTRLGALGTPPPPHEIDSPIPKIIHPTLPALWLEEQIIAAPHLAIGDRALGQKIKFLRDKNFSVKV